jgi:precorrin-2/cobalt-factor-2 C20-methyltransferase
VTLYGVGLGPGEADLVTVRGQRVLEDADVVYSPGRLSRSVATEHVPADRIGDIDFPMTRDEEELKRAWKAAAAEIAPRAREGTAAFVTLGDPNVYSTFGHLRRTLGAFHPAVEVEVVPGVSAVTAFATALGIEIASGASLALREGARGAAPTGPDRLLLFKLTDVPATHEKLTAAGYDAVYGRRLFMEQGETQVTDDPGELADRDYYTLAYAEKRGLDDEPVTASFEMADTDIETETEAENGSDTEVTAQADGGSRSSLGDQYGSAESGESDADRPDVSDAVAMERAEGIAWGDEIPEVSPR